MDHLLTLKHMCCGVIVWAKFGQFRAVIWAKLFLSCAYQKHHRFGKIQIFEGSLSGPSWLFLVAPNLAQRMTPSWPR